MNKFALPAAYQAARQLEMMVRQGGPADGKQACTELEMEIERFQPALELLTTEVNP